MCIYITKVNALNNFAYKVIISLNLKFGMVNFDSYTRNFKRSFFLLLIFINLTMKVKKYDVLYKS